MTEPKTEAEASAAYRERLNEMRADYSAAMRQCGIYKEQIDIFLAACRTAFPRTIFIADGDVAPGCRVRIYAQHTSAGPGAREVGHTITFLAFKMRRGDGLRPDGEGAWQCQVCSCDSAGGDASIIHDLHNYFRHMLDKPALVEFLCRP
jgi:hypothetical protein